MKSLLLTFLLIAGVFSGVNAQDSTAVNNSIATVYFMRSTGFQGSATAFTAFIDDTIVCKLNNKRYSIHIIAPGKHKFTVQFAGKKSKEKAEAVHIETEAGKTYYIQMIFQPGAFVNNLYCQEVTENSARTMLPAMKQDVKCE
ncbi:MAG TPA: DUF2846 domain-containing protein [Chitinophagaceae bacterium]|nr:DUF2846 domain-containing protein [Chitinophagaceae bacterium]